jgi:Mrp family chromosome partitioning ATPase/Ser/Thr protein kinase RdoA (MazF antagonist)
MKSKPKYLEGILIDQNALTLIAELFGFPKETVHYLTPLLISDNECVVLESKSDTAKKIILQTVQGGFLIKEIPWYCDDDSDVNFRHEFLGMLRSEGVAVSEVRKSLDGKSWVELGGRKFELQELKTGGTYKGNFEQIRSAGENLAKLHRASEGWSRGSAVLHATRLVQMAEQHVDLLSRGRGSFSPELSIFLEQMQKRVECIESEINWNDEEEEKVIAVHGDYSPWNVLFQANAVSAIIDFDNAMFDLAIHDLSEACLTFCAIAYRNRSTNFLDRIPKEFDEDKLLSLIGGYSSIRSLSIRDMEIFPKYVELTWIELACLGLNRSDFALHQVNEIKMFADRIRQIDWMRLFSSVRKEPQTSIPTKSSSDTKETKLANFCADKVIFVSSGKGGVGKSTVSWQLARALSSQGHSVGLFDADVHGPSLPTIANIDNRFEVKDGFVVPLRKDGVQLLSFGFMTTEERPLLWRGSILDGAIRHIWDKVIFDPLEYLVVDLPPGTGDVHVSLLRLFSSVNVLVVTTPHRLSLADTRRGAEMFRRSNARLIGVVENMSWIECESCRSKRHLFGGEAGRIIAEEFGMPLLAQLPFLPDSLDCVLGDKVEVPSYVAELAEKVKRAVK